MERVPERRRSPENAVMQAELEKEERNRTHLRASHPEPAVLQRYMRGESPRDEARAVVRHLLTGCPECVAITRLLWGLASHKPEPLPLDKRKGSSRLGREAGR